jgi:hypothetical protein
MENCFAMSRGLIQASGGGKSQIMFSSNHVSRSLSVRGSHVACQTASRLDMGVKASALAALPRDGD